MKKFSLFMMTLVIMTTVRCQTKEGAEFQIVENKGGATLGYSPSSGVKIITQDGFKFKDLNKNGKLDVYEDWRLSIDDRARDLAQQMSIEQVAGLMLYSAHQAIPSKEAGFGAGTYNGKPFSQSGAEAWHLSDAQKKFLQDDNLRHVLITSVQSPKISARWNNSMQAFVEGLGLGIPGNTSSDPRHSFDKSAEFNAGAGGQISIWPDGLGMAATFDPAIVRQFGEIASREYRALGITTALSPQIDLGAEPRWYRIYMTFGESPELSIDMARAYVDGFQTSNGKYEINDGWGYHSVNAMVKHWPGGGSGEGGRDAHWAFGKFAVYPGKNFNAHLRPFTEGAFKLDGKTKMASAVMPYYTISYAQADDSTNYGNGFSKYIVTDLLREKYGYDGVVCTDWLITANEGKHPGDFRGKPWGVEDQTIEQRHYAVLMAGVDQFGGNNEMQPVIGAYRIGAEKFGEEFMRKRFEQSAVRLLRNIFRLGLFENPYLDYNESAKTVANPDFVKAGYEAQLKSVVLLKNRKNVLPVRDRTSVYIPQIHKPAVRDWWGNISEEKTVFPVNREVIEKHYDLTDNPANADFSIVFISNPYTNADGGGYDIKDRETGGNGYIPVSLQYRPYTAEDAREQSIAAGDPVVDPSIDNRSYKGKTTTVLNAKDLDVVLETRKKMGNKPVIVVVNMNRPMIFNEFESEVDAILINFGIEDRAVIDIISGNHTPSGLLPLQMPADMTTVEKQMEDVPFDMKPHCDTEGNYYDFAFGLNWNGVIKDERTQKYKVNNK